MSKKVFIAEQETLLEVQEQVEKLVRNLVPDDAPIYGMVIHEASDLNPSTRVEYLGANKDFTPMSMNMSTHAMNYGSWAGWDWLKANVPVMCNWDGGIDYFLDPDDYTKKADGTNSDAATYFYINKCNPYKFQKKGGRTCRIWTQSTVSIFAWCIST